MDLTTLYCSIIDKLIVARIIFQLTNTISNLEDKYFAIATLILLQAAYEIISTTAHKMMLTN